MDRLTDLGSFRRVGDVSIDIDSIDSLRQKPGVFRVAGHMYKVAVDSGAVLVNRVDRPRTLFHSFIEFFTHRLADCSITSRTVRIQQRLTGLLSQPEVGDVKSSIKTDDSDSGSLSEDADEKDFSINADLSESTSSNDIIHL